jgi:transcription initiation factor IIF auxiliary subunit
VDYVTFTLHESFNLPEPLRVIPGQNPKQVKVPFSREDEVRISYIGWGYFEIPIVIHFKKHTNKDPVVINHMLKFKDKGDIKTISVNF